MGEEEKTKGRRMGEEGGTENDDEDADDTVLPVSVYCILDIVAGICLPYKLFACVFEI